MFRTRISFSFARLFRLRLRCSTKENASSRIPHSPKSSRPVSSQPKPIDISPAPTNPSPPLSTLSHIRETPARDSPAPIIIIGPEQDTTQIASTPSPEPTLSDDGGSQIHPDGLSLVGSLPINTRHVSFQVPPTRTDGSPSASSESLGKPIAPVGEVEMGTAVPPEITITSPTPAPDCDSAAEPAPRSPLAAESAAELNRPPSDSAKARHMSLSVPQPVRADSVRFSMPARPAAPRVTIKTEHARESIRQSKRTSLLPIGPAAGTTWREKRNSRWSREMSKRETPEVLKALC